jgi:hypothetical protein|tara:strand:+ start:776 stop:1513 length:738 start_codon:yes stop_codon:yes gene_type:complete
MVNIEELRKKYNQINKTPESGGADFLKKFLMMEEGTTQVRVLPDKNPDNNFYAETGIHRINDKNYHCPKVQGKECPMCDLSFKLWNTKDEGNMAIARQIKARKRFYLNAVERETGDVKILSVGIKLFSKILDCFFDEDYGDITDLKTGNDFKIVKDKSGEWPNYDKSSPKPTKSPAGSDAEIARWMDELHDIQGLVKVASYEELKELCMQITGEDIVQQTKAAADVVTESSDDGDDYLTHLKGLN